MSSHEARMLELTNIAAGHAASALSDLLGCTLVCAPPQHYVVEPYAGASGLYPADERSAAVFADLSGDGVAGAAGLLLATDCVERTLEKLVGEYKPMLDSRSHSALCELGNIAVSAAANALSGLQGVVVIPSVPRLGFSAAGGLSLESLCYEIRPTLGHFFESALFDRDSDFQMRFVWVPAIG